MMTLTSIINAKEIKRAMMLCKGIWQPSKTKECNLIRTSLFN